jgi:hypothetical protein
MNPIFASNYLNSLHTMIRIMKMTECNRNVKRVVVAHLKLLNPSVCVKGLRKTEESL